MIAANIAAIAQNTSWNHLSVHQWICSAIRDSQQPTSSVGFPFLKLPPSPCAVILVGNWDIVNHRKSQFVRNLRGTYPPWILRNMSWFPRLFPIFAGSTEKISFTKGQLGRKCTSSNLDGWIIPVPSYRWSDATWCWWRVTVKVEKTWIFGYWFSWCIYVILSLHINEDVLL